MKTNSSRTILQSLAVILPLVLALSGSVFAQESSLVASTPAFDEPKPAGPVEIASLDPLPSAPSSVATLRSAPGLPAIAASFAPIALVPVTAPPRESDRHPFWDNQNRVLFATVGALATVDFFATRANLASGGKELNPVTRVFSGSTPGLAANFALEAGSVVGVSYLFHKTGHHKLERMTAIVNIGASGAAVGYSLSHR